MSKRILVLSLLSAGMLSGLISCGGGGDTTIATGNGGIGGTGFVSGTISGFGSVFVNGVEFETDTTSIIVDGANSDQSALRIGMVVQVLGEINDDGVSGTASRIRYDEVVQGPVSGAPQVNADATQKTLQIFGVDVIASANGTGYRNTSFATLAANDLLEISGFLDVNGDLQATYIERKGGYPASDEGEITGVIENLDNTALTFGMVGSNVIVNFSGADLSDVSGGVLANGQYVEVEGRVTSYSTLSARKVEEEDFGIDDEADKAKVEGIVSEYVSDASFKVAGIRVDASGAGVTRSPANLVLANGLRVEVEGSVSNGVLIAQELEAESGKAKVFANIRSVNATTRTVTLEIPGMTGAVVVEINNKTEIEDEIGNVDSPNEVFSLSSGTFIRVEGYESADNRIVAKSFKRDNADKYLVQGVVDSWDTGSQLGILGLSMSTAGASFERENDSSYANEAAFYADLDVGTDVVKVVDRDLNGTVDEVEYED